MQLGGEQAAILDVVTDRPQEGLVRRRGVGGERVVQWQEQQGYHTGQLLTGQVRVHEGQHLDAAHVESRC